MINGYPAAILDRDSVINFERGYVHSIKDFDFIPGAIEAFIRFYKASCQLVIVTNQAGSARGYYDELTFNHLTAWMQECFIKAGTPIADVYFCPHHPNGKSKSL